jgi:DNA-binding NarL/FixJ family response regulator
MIQMIPTRLMCQLHCQMCFDSLRQRCDAQSEFELTCPAIEGVCELATILECRPDILVLDLDLPSDVLRLAAQVCRQATVVRVVVMGAKWTDLLLSKAIAAGVHGLLDKSEPIEALFEHFRHIARGETRISADLLGRLRYDTLRQQYVLTSGGVLTSLSGQQLEILRLLACGDSLKMVASKLKLSKKSIDGHKYRLMRKLGVKDRVLLSRLAIREGLIQA